MRSCCSKGQRFELVLQMRKNFIDDGAIFDNRTDLHLIVTFWAKQGIRFVNKSNQSSQRLRRSLVHSVSDSTAGAEWGNVLAYKTVKMMKQY